MSEKLTGGLKGNFSRFLPDSGLVLEGGNISEPNLLDLQVNGASKFSVGKAGNATATNGSAATPSYAMGTTGLYTRLASLRLNFAIAGFDSGIEIGPSVLALQSTASLFWTSGTLPSSGPDTYITRRGPANLRLGAADAAAPVAQTLSVQSVVAGTSNTAGADWTFTGSQGTGTGAGGSIIFQVAPAGSSGTAQNALVPALTINSSKNLTVSGTSVFLNGTSPGSSSSYIAQDSNYLNINAPNGKQMYFSMGENWGIFSIIQSSGQTGSAVLQSDGSLAWYIQGQNAPVNGNFGLRLFSDVPLTGNILAQRNGVNAQAFRLYNTYTDASNYERGVFDWSTTANVLRIGTEAAGTGTVRNIALVGGNVGIGTASPVQPLDIYGGSGDGTTNEPYGLRIRGTNVAGNSTTLQIGANGVYYSYIQSAYWGNGYVSPLYINPKGSQVYINSTTNTISGLVSVSLISGGDVLIKSPAGSNMQLGRIGFSVAGTYGVSGSFPAFIGGYADNGVWSSGIGLTFNTIASADISGSSGTERMRISSAGNVGIGNTTPAHKLSVDGGIYLTPGDTNRIWSGSDNLRLGNYPQLLVSDTLQIVGGQQSIIFGGTGAYATIGSNVPWDFVKTTTAQAIRIYGTFTDASNYERLLVSSNSTASYIQSQAIGTGTARPLFLGANSATAVTIAANGNVGVGTTSPTSTLHVNTTSNSQFKISGRSSGSIEAYQTASQYMNFAIVDGGGRGITITTQPNELAAGDSNTAYLAAIASGIGSGVTLSTKADSDGNHMSLRARGELVVYTNSGTTSLIERMRVAANGNVGIGNTTPTNKLSVAGTIADQSGDVRSTPINAQSASYTLVTSDNGKTISITTGGVIVDATGITSGQIFSIFNNSNTNQTITQSANSTMYLAGTNTTGNRTLTQYGVATVMCVAANTFVISGAGLS